MTVLTWEEIPTHQFDFINTEQVFEHLSQPLETLEYLSKALKPHGIIKISVPNGWNIEEKLAIGDWDASKESPQSLNPVAPLEHVNCFTYQSIIKMAQLVGLKPLVTIKIAIQKTPECPGR